MDSAWINCERCGKPTPAPTKWHKKRFCSVSCQATAWKKAHPERTKAGKSRVKNKKDKGVAYFVGYTNLHEDWDTE